MILLEFYFLSFAIATEVFHSKTQYVKVFYATGTKNAQSMVRTSLL